jgi:hypothetical protein
MTLLRQRFVNSKGFIGTAIDILSDGDVDHTETDSGTGWLGAHDDGGIQNRPYDYMIPGREFVFSVEVPDDIYAEGMAWAMAQIGTPYNFGAIVGIEFHDDSLTQKGHKICSQFGYDITRKMGLKALNEQVIRPWDVTPMALMLSPIWTKVEKHTGGF